MKIKQKHGKLIDEGDDLLTQTKAKVDRKDKQP
jgi:hypothetical protein